MAEPTFVWVVPREIVILLVGAGVRGWRFVGVVEGVMVVVVVVPIEGIFSLGEREVGGRLEIDVYSLFSRVMLT